MRSADWTVRLDVLERKLDPTRRFVDMGARLRIWRRNPSGEPVPSELLPRVYGGKYDRLLKRYISEPEAPVEVACHEGQIELLTFENPEILRLLALGSPGAGKTFAAIRKALLSALERPNSIGGLIAPTNDRRQILWRDFLELVEPLGWVEDARISKKEIVLTNRVVIQVLAAKAPSTQHGSPLQGRSFDWCVVDESQNVDDEAHAEIAARGRRAGKSYRIYETATNAQVPAFRVRLEQFKINPQCKLIRFSGLQNPWVDLEWWERLRRDMSDRDYREKILAEDVPAELLLYPRFSFQHNVSPRPMLGRDVTEQLISERYQRPGVKWVVATDFGILTTTSIFLKAYQGRGGDRLWWACDEINSGAGITADLHARKILSRYDPDEVFVVADPHLNTKDADKSDYHLMSREGLTVVPAAHGKISKKHRISMMNALLEDADGIRRFFVDCDDSRTPRCKKLVQSFMSLQYNEVGEAEKDKKNASDLTHWTAAVGYGVYPWERIRGTAKVEFIKPKAGLR